MRRTHIEHMSAGLPPLADIARRGWYGRKVPIGDIHSFWFFETEGSAQDQKGKKDAQGLIVLATRKPRVSNRTLVWRLTRTAARTERADSLRQEPPRTTRKLGSPPRSHADPSVGAPS